MTHEPAPAYTVIRVSRDSSGEHAVDCYYLHFQHLNHDGTPISGIESIVLSDRQSIAEAMAFARRTRESVMVATTHSAWDRVTREMHNIGIRIERDVLILENVAGSHGVLPQPLDPDVYKMDSDTVRNRLAEHLALWASETIRYITQRP